MVTNTISPPGLIVGNYCHDLLLRDNTIFAQSLGGAASFVSVILDSLSLPFHLVSKVGPDFAYNTNHPPIVVPTSQTTLFHAHFFSSPIQPPGHNDRVLKRIGSCEPIRANDIPSGTRFKFGMAVGVGGEILPETLEKMLDICDVVFVDIQALIRTFDPEEGGRVKLVTLKESGFYHLLPRIGFLKCSSDEAVLLDLEEVRKWCCVVVTQGKEGCEVWWEDDVVKVAPFDAVEVDPTGAGDCFLGGFVSGIVEGLDVGDAALLGNFFGSLAVAQVGPPNLHLTMFQMVKDEMHKRKMQDFPYLERRDDWQGFRKPSDQDQFYASLVVSATNAIVKCQIQESEWNLLSSPKSMEQNNVRTSLSLNSVHDESIPIVDSKP
ncbi:hypothetical protein TanjilG_32556 [Lupinus angustifolius]|uniref:Carbohydrate kinase PfkB domain-containing protein n=1 Tax=Lupinus angustifolius TaxID=3871 RepID=A0A4P1R8E0_LUPAN|nr:PREDICTED: inositol 3-kinase [Lupinus angustifolius]OIW04364.1 hypothetical protein TanjilG_32556 [Lupinus angustifolius]